MFQGSYTKLPLDCDDSETNVSNDASTESPSRRTRRSCSFSIWPLRSVYLALALFLLVCIALLYASYVFYERAQKLFHESQDIHFTPSPEASSLNGLSDIASIYHIDRFVGTFDAPSPWKGPPSKQVDAAWGSYVRDRTLRISYDDVIRAGGSEALVKFDDKYGGGYMAYLEMPHQLHCLYSLWKHTWPSKYKSFEMGLEDSSSTFRMHLDHCTDLLRQKLLCDGDSTLITYNWVKHLSHPTPINSPHQCRNSTAIFEWLDRNEPHLPNEAFDKPSDAIELAWWP